MINTWFNLFTDGINAVIQNFFVIFYFFLTTYGIGLFLSQFLTSILKLSNRRNFSRNVCIGILIIPIFILPAVLSSNPEKGIKSIGLLLLFFALLTIVREFLLAEKKLQFDPSSIIYILFFIFLILSRLAFLQKSIFPSYADSATHYGIVKNLLESNLGRSNSLIIEENFTRYYHLGFHIITAWLVSLFNLPIEKGIILSGQLFFILASLSIYYIIFEITQQRNIALVGAIFSGFCWQLPSFSVNWGKYPAIAGLALFPITFSLLVSTQPKKIDWRRISFLVFVIGMNIFFHSRILFSTLIVFFSIWLVRLFNKIPKLIHYVIDVVLVIALLLSVLFRSSFLMDYYGGKYLLTILLAICAPFSIYYFEKISVPMISLLIFLLFSPLISINFAINGSIIPLFDGVFSLLSVYIPISIIMTTGIFGISKLFSTMISPVFLITIGLLIMLRFDVRNNLYAHPCCNYIGNDEMESVNWINEHTILNQTIIISGIPYNDYLIGSDAGIWIHVLTERPVEIFSANDSWESSKIHYKACLLGKPLVFICSEPNSFTSREFFNTNWYRLIFTNNRDSIYQVIGCN